MKLVLDADVLIGALDAADAQHARARELFAQWDERDTLLVSVVNLTEVLVAPAADAARLRLARTAIAALGVKVHRPDGGVAVDAARLRRAHPISLADAYCLATARRVGGTVASFDEKVTRTAAAEGIASAS